MAWGDGKVLMGPRVPYWSCSKCSERANWRCRAECRGCGRTAPQDILIKAKKADQEARAAEKAKGHGAGRPRGGDHSIGSLESFKADILSSIRKEMGANKGGLGRQVVDQDQKEEDGEPGTQ